MPVRRKENPFRAVGEFVQTRIVPIIPKPVQEAFKILRSSINLQLHRLPNFGLEKPMLTIDKEIDQWQQRETMHLDDRIVRHARAGRRSFATSAMVLGGELIALGVAHIVTGGASTALLLAALAHQEIGRLAATAGAGLFVSPLLYGVRQRHAVEILRERPNVAEEVARLARLVAIAKKEEALERQTARGVEVATALSPENPFLAMTQASIRTQEAPDIQAARSKQRRDNVNTLRDYIRRGRPLRILNNLLNLVGPSSNRKIRHNSRHN